MDTITDTDLLLFEFELDEPGCEADHTPLKRKEGPQVLPCTYKVVAYKSVSCARLFFGICANSLKFNEQVIDWGLHCPQCFRYAGDCWSFFPVEG